MKIVTAIQARTSSRRLPGKTLLPLYGKPLLIRMVERVSRANLKGTVVVATSEMSDDDVIEEICTKQGISCFRGSLTDLLDRHYKLALAYEADALVKIPSDCPLIDPLIVDQVIGYYLQNYPSFDFVSNLHPATYPDGNDVEIISIGTLKTAWEKAQRDFEREHTTPYIWENPETFRIGNVCWPRGYDFSTTHRWTIDYQEDYQFISEVYDRLYPEDPGFGLDDILLLMKVHPEISGINNHLAGRYWYENHLGELHNIDNYKRKIMSYEV
ncbi:MAG: glycosyltransferase family protein [Bacteroidota bacterium]